MSRKGLFLQIPPNVEDTPQILELKARLRDKSALLYALRLWRWAFNNESRVCSLSPQALALACQWEGEPALLRESLCAVGLMRTHDGYVRGFDDRYKKVFEQHHDDAKRQRDKRATAAAIKQEVAAPKKRSAAAERQAKYKAKKRAEAKALGTGSSVTPASPQASPGDASSVTPGVTGDARVTSPVTGADAQIGQEMQNTRHPPVRTPKKKKKIETKTDQETEAAADPNLGRRVDPPAGAAASGIVPVGDPLDPRGLAACKPVAAAPTGLRRQSDRPATTLEVRSAAEHVWPGRMTERNAAEVLKGAWSWDDIDWALGECKERLEKGHGCSPQLLLLKLREDLPLRKNANSVASRDLSPSAKDKSMIADDGTNDVIRLLGAVQR